MRIETDNNEQLRRWERELLLPGSPHCIDVDRLEFRIFPAAKRKKEWKSVVFPQNKNKRQSVTVSQSFGRTDTHIRERESENFPQYETVQHRKWSSFGRERNSSPFPPSNSGLSLSPKIRRSFKIETKEERIFDRYMCSRLKSYVKVRMSLRTLIRNTHGSCYPLTHKKKFDPNNPTVNERKKEILFLFLIHSWISFSFSPLLIFVECLCMDFLSQKSPLDPHNVVQRLPDIRS